MNTINAVILGILQGLTEFLPVSSSGHLAIGKHILNFESPDMLFDVMLHAATLLVVLIYFRRRVFLIIKAFFGIFFKGFKKIILKIKDFYGVLLLHQSLQL